MSKPTNEVLKLLDAAVEGSGVKVVVLGKELREYSPEDVIKTLAMRKVVEECFDEVTCFQASDLKFYVIGRSSDGCWIGLRL